MSNLFGRVADALCSMVLRDRGITEFAPVGFVADDYRRWPAHEQISLDAPTERPQPHQVRCYPMRWLSTSAYSTSVFSAEDVSTQALGVVSFGSTSYINGYGQTIRRYPLEPQYSEDWSSRA